MTSWKVWNGTVDAGYRTFQYAKIAHATAILSSAAPPAHSTSSSMRAVVIDLPASIGALNSIAVIVSMSFTSRVPTLVRPFMPFLSMSRSPLRSSSSPLAGLWRGTVRVRRSSDCCVGSAASPSKSWSRGASWSSVVSYASSRGSGTVPASDVGNFAPPPAPDRCSIMSWMTAMLVWNPAWSCCRKFMTFSFMPPSPGR